MEMSLIKDSLLEKLITLQHKVIFLLGLEEDLEIVYKIFAKIINELENTLTKTEEVLKRNPVIFKYINCISMYFIEKIHLPYQNFIAQKNNKKVETHVRGFKIKTLIYVDSKVG